MRPFPYPRLVSTSCWSFGRDRKLAADLEELFIGHELDVADLWSDPDLNRTEATLVGPDRNHSNALFDAVELVLPAIDLNRHVGTHPRVGALDHVRFEYLDEDSAAFGVGITFAEHLARFHPVPVYYDGPESEPGSEARILNLREAGFGGLGKVAMHSDFGPFEPHPEWGVTIVTVGPRYLSAWVDLADPSTRVAEEVAVRLNELREQGDAVLLGVRAEGWALPTREGSRVGLGFEMPERTVFDEVAGFVGKEARLRGAAPQKAFARGAWTEEEARRASRFVFGRKQVLNDVFD